MFYRYLKNKLQPEMVLKCDRGFHPIKEISANEAPNITKKATYANWEYGFLGVVPSPNGPFLFVNHDQYLFTDLSWEVELSKGEGQKKFTLQLPNIQTMIFKYPRVEVDPADVWAREDVDDFFLWLVSNRNNDEFIRLWTDA